MRPRAPWGVALLLGLVLGPLTGCSTDSDDEPGSSEPTSTSGTPTTAAPTPTQPPSPTVTPATGPQVTAAYLGTPVLRVRLPEDLDWRIQPGGNNASTNNADGDFIDISTNAIQTAMGKSLGFYAQLTVDGGKSTLYPNLKRVEGREVAGVTGYVAEGSADKFSYVFGTVYEDSHVTVAFQFPQDDATAREWIESVLASAEWL